MHISKTQHLGVQGLGYIARPTLKTNRDRNDRILLGELLSGWTPCCLSLGQPVRNDLRSFLTTSCHQLEGTVTWGKTERHTKVQRKPLLSRHDKMQWLNVNNINSVLCSSRGSPYRPTCHPALWHTCWSECFHLFWDMWRFLPLALLSWR